MKIDQATVNERSQFTLNESTIEQQFLFKTIISEMTNTMQKQEPIDSVPSQVLEPIVLLPNDSLDLSKKTKKEESRQFDGNSSLTQSVEYSLIDEMSRYQDDQNPESVIQTEDRQNDDTDINAKKPIEGNLLQEPASQIQITNNHLIVTNNRDPESQKTPELVAPTTDRPSQKILNSKEEPVVSSQLINQTHVLSPVNELDQVVHDPSEQVGNDLVNRHQTNIASEQVSEATEHTPLFFKHTTKEPNRIVAQTNLKTEDIDFDQVSLKASLTEGTKQEEPKQRDSVVPSQLINQTHVLLPVRASKQVVENVSELRQSLNRVAVYPYQNQIEQIAVNTAGNLISMQENIKDYSIEQNVTNTLSKEPPLADSQQGTIKEVAGSDIFVKQNDSSKKQLPVEDAEMKQTIPTSLLVSSDFSTKRLSKIDRVVSEKSIVSSVANTVYDETTDQRLMTNIQTMGTSPLIPTQSSENTITIPIVTKDGLSMMDQKSEKALFQTLNEGMQKLKHNGDKQQITIQLFPDSLGKVEVKLSMKQDTIDLQFKMDNLHTKTLFESVTHKFQEILTKVDHVEHISNQPISKVDSQLVVHDLNDIKPQAQLDSGGAFQQNQEKTAYKKRTFQPSSEIGQSDFDVKESIREGNISILV
ncbi:flagellar hook-length control protein FliK [Enterococcus bulliens]